MLIKCDIKRGLVFWWRFTLVSLLRRPHILNVLFYAYIFFFWPLYWLSFDWWLLFTPLVSLIFSYIQFVLLVHKFSNFKSDYRRYNIKMINFFNHSPVTLLQIIPQNSTLPIDQLSYNPSPIFWTCGFCFCFCFCSYNS